jgi:hypothetical protein
LLCEAFQGLCAIVPNGRTDPPEHLRVEVDEFARPGTLIAHDGWPRAQPVESGEAGPPQDGVDRAAGKAALPGQDMGSDPRRFTPRTERGHHGRGVTTSLVADGARVIHEVTGLGPAPPLRAALAADAAALAAAVVVNPERTRAASSGRPRGVRQALGWAIEGSFFDCGFYTNQPRIGALSPSTT